MSVIAGLNHVAIVTADLDRFIEFYTRVFELAVVFEERAPGLRHAILRLGHDSWLHPAEIASNPHAPASATMFQRGHLDHLSLTASSRPAFHAVRERLMQANASDGRIDDLGAFHSMWFEDPDGMRGEVTLIVDSSLRGIHEPREMPSASVQADRQ